MKVNDQRPANFSGVPFLLVVLSFVLILLVPGLSERLLPLSLFGWLLLAASWGTSVEIEGEVLRLRYAFGRLSVNIPLPEIVEVKVVSRLERGILVREFPGMFILLASVVVLALADLLLLPEGLLEGYYFGDIALILFGLLYLSALSLPFRPSLAGILGVLLLALTALLMRLKLGFVNPAFLIIFGIVALLFVSEYYSRDYVVIATSRGKFLVMSQKPEALLSILGGGASNEA